MRGHLPPPSSFPEPVERFERSRPSCAPSIAKIGPEITSRSIFGGKRKLSVLSGAHSQEPGLKRTWRGTEHTDWVLLLGSKEYAIHKVILSTGDHASYFLAGAFRKHCGQQDKTNLTELIPERCWPYFETLLDFMYSGEVDLEFENWASMLKMADTLQIESLYQRCVSVGGELIAKDSAARLVADIVEFEIGGELEQQVVQLAVDVISSSFSSYRTCDLSILPVKVLQMLLVRNDLDVLNEDKVFDFLLELENEVAFNDDTSLAELWKCCRLENLSRDKCLQAAQVQHFPKEAFAWALAQKIAPPPSGPLTLPAWASEWVLAFGPRGREITFKVQNPLDYQSKRSLRSPEHQLDDKFRWCLLLFPLGTEGGPQKQVASFVELVPESHVGESWEVKNVLYFITMVNWKDEDKSITKEHKFNFSNKNIDNGWHKGWVLPEAMTCANGWLNEHGELLFRARICMKSAVFVHGRRDTQGKSASAK